jgi:hypothetical protein
MVFSFSKINLYMDDCLCEGPGTCPDYPRKRQAAVHVEASIGDLS